MPVYLLDEFSSSPPPVPQLSPPLSPPPLLLFKKKSLILSLISAPTPSLSFGFFLYTALEFFLRQERSKHQGYRQARLTSSDSVMFKRVSSREVPPLMPKLSSDCVFCSTETLLSGHLHKAVACFVLFFFFFFFFF